METTDTQRIIVCLFVVSVPAATTIDWPIGRDIMPTTPVTSINLITTVRQTTKQTTINLHRFRRMFNTNSGMLQLWVTSHVRPHPPPKHGAKKAVLYVNT